ncbi:MAG: Rne/Rng family ribonuclease [Acidobacteriia bacterium]|nr:Rne/Rng family ribonuclease [Terriglobia bacterium]
MSKELIISANHHETRVALTEDEQVVEVFHQRENEYSLAGSIHKGRVTRVLPGMQSAFVDIGLERDAFLYVSDFFEDNEEYDKIVTSVEEKVLKLDRVAQTPAAVTTPVPEAEPLVPTPVTATPNPEPVPASEAPRATEPVSTAPAPLSGDRRDDRDRRGGRRGRRRRGGKGRGLPDSKFYSPGSPTAEPQPQASQTPQTPEAAEPKEARVPAPAQRQPEPAVAQQTEDEFFVLPGESLAKYSRGDEPGGELDDLDSESGAESSADLAEETQREPQSPEALILADAELEAIVEVDFDGDEEVPENPEVSVSGFGFVSEIRAEQRGAGQEVAEPEAEAAEDVEFVTTDAAELADFVESTADAPSEAVAELVEQIAAEEVAEEAAMETVVGAEEAVPQEAEGPEPARIPTSLTATLREQGPRYLHRVSRRTRRRNRGGGPEPSRSGQQFPEAGEQAVRTAPEPRAAAGNGRPERAAAPSISDLLREGQEIIVQIAKEPLGQKGARITSHIALPGRFLVYMPTVDHIGVSRKIPSDEERSRLKRVLQANRGGIPGGFIVRTAGEGHTEEELRTDMMFLYNLWLDLRQKAERKPAPALIHHDLNVVERVLRDQLTSAFKNIWVDNEELYESVLRFVQRFQPALVSRVKMYTRSTPIFDEFGVTAELEKALRPKVWLKSGGYIVINQTEALVAIDVNTGKYVGKSNRLEDTIVKTNTDAIKEIVRQIRLRDLGGIIVVDFIDMDERKNRQKVMQALEESMHSDRAPYKILQFNDFGLVAITRKRVKQSLERTLCTPCPYCEGAGYVKSPQTVVGEILQEAHKIAKAVEGKDVLLRVSPDVAKLLKSSHNSYLQELEEILGRTVIVKTDSQLHQEKFDLA